MRSSLCFIVLLIIKQQEGFVIEGNIQVHHLIESDESGDSGDGETTVISETKSPVSTSVISETTSATSASSETTSETSLATSETTPATSTSPTASPLEPHEPDFTGVFVNFEFSISLNGTWNDLYADSNSKEYQKLAADVRASLDVVYYNSYAPGYSDIVVKNFVSGSIVVHYDAVFEAEEAFTNYDAIKEALNDVYEDLLVVPSIGGYSVNDEYLEQNMPAQINYTQQTVAESQSNICSTSRDLCYPYEKCVYNSSYTSGVICVPGCYQLCSAEHQECLYEGGTTATCRCVEGHVLEDGVCVMPVLENNSAAVISLSVVVVLLATCLVIVAVVELIFRKRKSGKHTGVATNSDRFDDGRHSVFVNTAFQSGEIENGNVRTSDGDSVLLSKELQQQLINMATTESYRL